MSVVQERPYIIRTYDRWIILVIVLVAGWYLFRPIFAFTVYYRGLSFERMIRTSAAEHYYGKSTAIYPRIPEGWIGLGELYYMQAPSQPAAYARGIATMRRGLAYNPKSSQLAFDLGRMYFRASDYRNALPALLQSIADDPQRLFAWDYAAWTSLRLGRRADALRYWHQVLKIAPTDSAVLTAVKRYGR